MSGQTNKELYEKIAQAVPEGQTFLFLPNGNAKHDFLCMLSEGVTIRLTGNPEKVIEVAKKIFQ